MTLRILTEKPLDSERLSSSKMQLKHKNFWHAWLGRLQFDDKNITHCWRVSMSSCKIWTAHALTLWNMFYMFGNDLWSPSRTGMKVSIRNDFNFVRSHVNTVLLNAELQKREWRNWSELIPDWNSIRYHVNTPLVNYFFHESFFFVTWELSFFENFWTFHFLEMCACMYWGWTGW